MIILSEEAKLFNEVYPESYLELTKVVAEHNLDCIVNIMDAYYDDDEDEEELAYFFNLQFHNTDGSVYNDDAYDAVYDCLCDATDIYDDTYYDESQFDVDIDIPEEYYARAAELV